MQFDSSLINQRLGDNFQILDDNGELLPGRELPDLSDEEMVSMYADMAFARHFDERAVSLQRQGRVGTYPPGTGHEASQIGSTYALTAEDWILPTYRENAVGLTRGVPPEAILRYWMGHEDGNTALVNERIFPFNIGVGALVPHAAGIGMAAAIRGDDTVTLCHFGDGSTSQGDVHEGLNFAGVFNAPVVFFCNNNQYAISVPRERQTASQTIAQKALAYGITGIQVDGMDPFAVYEVTRRAIDRARTQTGNERPTLIESVQYRLGAHTTADDPTVYRDQDEVERWREKDPLNRMERFLRNTGRVDDEKINAIQAENEQRMKRAIESVEEGESSDPNEMFDHVFAERTTRLQAQRDYLATIRNDYGDDALIED